MYFLCSETISNRGIVMMATIGHHTETNKTHENMKR